MLLNLKYQSDAIDHLLFFMPALFKINISVSQSHDLLQHCCGRVGEFVAIRNATHNEKCISKTFPAAIAI